MLTSANAALLGGEALAAYRALPAYAVGEASAAAARAAGFGNIRTGPADGAALLEMIAGDGVRQLLHLAGRDRIGLSHPELRVEAVALYAADAVESLPPEAEAAIRRKALVLLHSPRAAALFGGFVGARREAIRAMAISPATAAAAGEGWAEMAVAARPRDEALLELAAKLCQNEGE